jgi:hypothetical protein
MLKHVGLHNAQKVTIVLHQMPAEDHMCLIMYDDKLPPRYFQAVKSVLNTPAGQEVKDFATALEGAKLDDDRNLARVLYTEGHLKKVPCNQVFATPFGYDSANKIKLNELNAYTSKIAEGGEALQKLAEFDANKGMHKKARKENLGEGTAVAVAPTPTPVRPTSHVSQEEAHVSQSAQFEQVQHQNYAPVSVDPKTAGAELRMHGENLRNAALQMLQQAKLLTEKAEKIFPTEPKRGRGRPKGTGTKAVAKTK